MIMNKSTINTGLLSVFCFAISLSAFAQQQETQQQQQQEERRTTIDSIDVIRDYRPILADAVKIRRSPDMTNKREYQPKLNYSIIDKKLDITTGTKRLDIQEIPAVRFATPTNNYVKIGAGNFSTLLGEIYLANTDYQDTRFGAYIKHLSQEGNIENQNYGQQEITVFGRQLYDQFTISGDLGYKRYATRFFGQPFDVNNISLNPNPEKQAFNDIFLHAELTSNRKNEEVNTFDYSVKATGYYYNNAFDAKENSFVLSGYLNREINTFHIGAHVSADFTGVSDIAYKQQNHIARINPYVRFKGDNYNLVIGANLVSEFGGDSSRINILPNVLLDFALVPEYAHLFAGVDGDVQKASLRDFSRENPWLNQNINISNAVERFHIYGGIKGNAGATFGYKIGLDYRRIENMAFLINSPMQPYKFDVIYEDANKASSVFGLEAEMNVRVSEMISLGGKLNFNEYDLQTYEEAWYLPKLQLAANTKINISDKLYIDGELLFMGQTYTQKYTYNTLLGTNPIVSLPEKHTIPSFVDLNAGLEFRVTDRLGLYGRVNNILGINYERYQYYPRLGLNVMGGVNFSF